MQAISVVGNYAYVENGYGMAIFDIGNPFTPVKLGEVLLPYPYNGYPYSIFVDSKYAYIAAVDHGLRIVDISNLVDPVEVSHYDVSNWAMDIVVVDNYAYISTGVGGGGGLRIIDVSNPESPIEIGHHDLSGGDAENLAVIDNYVYLANIMGLRVIDVSTPTSPVEIGIHENWRRTDIATTNKYGYFVAVDDKKLFVADISDPAKPTLISTYDTIGYPYKVIIQGNFLYISNWPAYDKYQAGLEVVDISAPDNPVQVGFYEAPLSGVAIQDEYAYVISGTDSLQVIDISTPSNMTGIGSYHTLGGVGGMALANNKVYAVTASGLNIFDVSNPANPISKGFYDKLDEAGGFDIVGDYAYVIAGHQFKVLDLSNSLVPKQVGYFEPEPYEPLNQSIAAISNNYIFLKPNVYCAAPECEKTLSIIDVSDPSQPVEVGYFSSNAFVLGAAILDNYAYVVQQDGHLVILDISNISAPIQVGSYEIPQYVWSIKIVGHYAYLASEEGLLILDLSEAESPTQAGIYKPEGTIFRLLVEGQYLYTIEDFRNLRVLDISNPVMPVEVGYFDMSGFPANDVVVIDEYIYISSSSGMYILYFDSQSASGGK